LTIGNELFHRFNFLGCGHSSTEKILEKEILYSDLLAAYSSADQFFAFDSKSPMTLVWHFMGNYD
jgi:hypothetical protein